ncbi:hypothetical protein VSU19_03190, partial [Verrucomicrobiales bacterium BCK34]|nr:hypothetical protein [Verrucomicrobiales bacterium BCK34]
MQPSVKIVVLLILFSLSACGRKELSDAEKKGQEKLKAELQSFAGAGDSPSTPAVASTPASTPA